MSLDPLQRLPLELSLHLCSYLPLSTLSSLHLTSPSWHAFLDAHAEILYRFCAYELLAPARQARWTTGNGKGKAPLRGDESLETLLGAKQNVRPEYWNVEGWREFCKRSVQLSQQWASPTPIISSKHLPLSHLIWRFRIDFSARLLISTAHQGGLFVHDLDDATLLWSLPKDQVDGHAHLEYDDGTLVYDTGERSLRAWRRADLMGVKDAKRGHFIQLDKDLTHPVRTRGFQLRYPTLCVVSDMGQAFIWDLSLSTPKLLRTLDIIPGAVGHLEQNDTHVLFSLGLHGYHFYAEDSDADDGRMLNPADLELNGANIFHVEHQRVDTPAAPIIPDRERSGSSGGSDGNASTLSRADHVVLRVRPGPYPEAKQGGERRMHLEDDEWGAGMIRGAVFVGVSKGGRVLVCTDWPGYLDGSAQADTCVSIVECLEPNGLQDLGGWLTMGAGRAAFEVHDRVYILQLPTHGLLDASDRQPVLHALQSNAHPKVPLPISFMQLTEDSLLTTYAWIQVVRAPHIHIEVQKSVRIASWAYLEGQQAGWTTTGNEKEGEEEEKVAKAALWLEVAEEESEAEDE